MQLLINPTDSNLIVPNEMSLKIIQQYYNEIHQISHLTKQDSEVLE